MRGNRSTVLFRRLFRWLRGCQHDGPMMHVGVIGPGADLWCCAQCEAELVALDVDVAAAASQRDRLAA
jgi:hypothetical protein